MMVMESAGSFCEISSVTSLKQNDNFFDCGIPKEEKYEVPMENDKNQVFFKNESIEISDIEIKEHFLCASRGPTITSTPIQHERVNIQMRSDHQSFFASRGELFVSKIVNYNDLDNDTINRSLHIPPGSFLISRPVDYKEKSDNTGVSLRTSNDTVLISKPLEQFTETFDQQDFANLNNNNIESSAEDVKKFPTIVVRKSFRCHLCSNSYTRKDHLTLHMRTHDGVKPFKCQQCQASFTYRHVLKHHELVHSGKKPFTCEFCNAGFTKKFNLKSHVSRVHKAFNLELIEEKFNMNHNHRIRPIDRLNVILAVERTNTTEEEKRKEKASAK